MLLRCANNSTYCTRGMFPKDEEIQQEARDKHNCRIQHRCLQYTLRH